MDRAAQLGRNEPTRITGDENERQRRRIMGNAAVSGLDDYLGGVGLELEKAGAAAGSIALISPPFLFPPSDQVGDLRRG